MLYEHSDELPFLVVVGIGFGFGGLVVGGGYFYAGWWQYIGLLRESFGSAGLALLVFYSVAYVLVDEVDEPCLVYL
jgi:hypothetical protein